MTLHSSNNNLLESSFESTKYLLDTIQKGCILSDSNLEKSHSEPTQKSELALAVRQYKAGIVYSFYEKFSLNLVSNLLFWVHFFLDIRTEILTI